MSLTWREPGADGQVPFAPLPEDTEYWVRHCEGFRVDSPRRRLGVVECVAAEDAMDGTEVVAVRTGGLRSRRVIECRLIVLDPR